MRTWAKVAGALGAVGGAVLLARTAQAAVERNEGFRELKLLLAIMPELPALRAYAMLPHLTSAMEGADITTRRRKAAFLAQLAFESVELKHLEELASGAAYEGRKDLGNTQPGDGVRYKGRGPIQLTGRANYREYGEALGVDLENNPKRAADLDVGFRVAAEYWKRKGLNALADADTYEGFKEITRRINGGLNGLAQREVYWRRARTVLGGAA